MNAVPEAGAPMQSVIDLGLKIECCRKCKERLT
jgi:hypothetical protein